MSMKTLYITLVAIGAALGIGLLIWKKPELFKPSVDKAKNLADRTWGATRNAANKAADTARSTAGRVANAAGDLLHTERDNPNTPSQPA
jgi:hypothetical protein